MIKRACQNGMLLSDIYIEIFLYSIKLNGVERAKISILPMVGQHNNTLALS
jgi:hypothetical protein